MHIKKRATDPTIYNMPILLSPIGNDITCLSSNQLEHKEISLKITALYLLGTFRIDLANPIIIPYAPGDIKIDEVMEPQELVNDAYSFTRIVSLSGVVNFDEGYFYLNSSSEVQISQIKIETLLTEKEDDVE